MRKASGSTVQSTQALTTGTAIQISFMSPEKSLRCARGTGVKNPERRSGPGARGPWLEVPWTMGCLVPFAKFSEPCFHLLKLLGKNNPVVKYGLFLDPVPPGKRRIFQKGPYDPICLTHLVLVSICMSQNVSTPCCPFEFPLRKSH